ncbi:V-type ATP synthase subunit D [Candidatus Micrarchaeota archaeon]|nr:V-type ATP synthase subunit D [Candidatus Micrarchaeota archaeon]
MAETFNPTRMELLKAKEKIKLARKGHKLLKQKRDALILEFFKILEKAKDLRGELNAQMKKAFESIAIAQAYHGSVEVEAAALAVQRAPTVEVSVRNIMGVKIPSIQAGGIKEKTLLERGYGAMSSSAKIDETAQAFEKALTMIALLAETENALKKLIKEIEKTKRRVNALEYVVIPRLTEQSRTILFRLDEIERESFFMLKMVKKKMARKKQN